MSKDTKKQRILELVSSNPFLSMKEIANKVGNGTTENYVKSILSQEGISLRKLRKKFANKAKVKVDLNIKEESNEENQ